ncbi:hypothetical protein [Frankia sp. R43]|uniref:hypothetical protein n=1 Tax=Frankia sp. R43 TaxID=269536 RepID=UPI000ACE0015|nr:hypothetical protein [Frankia sp. R43]
MTRTGSAALPRRFLLVRDRDISGVSGLGEVAQGTCWDDGVAALHWHGEHRSTGIYASMEQVRAIHGHGGATRVVWLDWLGEPSARWTCPRSSSRTRTPPRALWAGT